MRNIQLLPAILPMLLIATNAQAESALSPANKANLVAPKTTQPLAAKPETREETKPASPILSLVELGDLRGGTQIAINQQQFNSTNTGHRIDGDFTAGDVDISDNAFSNFSGLGNFVFNTGAQSALQAGLTVTVNVDN